MRLIDLHCDWALQYAAETTQYDSSRYPEIPGRVAQVDRYLMGASLALLGCYRAAGDWEQQADPWAALVEMIARYEAEFSGRILTRPDDVDRWLEEPEDGLCWGLLGVTGFDFLVRSPADLDRLGGIFTRGVRVFQAVETAASLLGGSRDAGDDRGLSDLGRAFLERLIDLAPAIKERGPRPLLDLAHMNARTCSEVLDWFEADGTRAERLPLLHSHGAVDILGSEILGRLRALGATVGLSVGSPAIASVQALKDAIDGLAAIPFRGRAGYEGIGIGTDFVQLASTFLDLGDAPKIAAWLTRTFTAEAAALVGFQNARRLVLQASGARV